MKGRKFLKKERKVGREGSRVCVMIGGRMISGWEGEWKEGKREGRRKEGGREGGM